MKDDECVTQLSKTDGPAMMYLLHSILPWFNRTAVSFIPLILGPFKITNFFLVYLLITQALKELLILQILSNRHRTKLNLEWAKGKIRCQIETCNFANLKQKKKGNIEFLVMEISLKKKHMPCWEVKRVITDFNLVLRCKVGMISI